MTIKNIQALRAIAANGVLISHLLIVEQKYSHSGAVLPADAYFGAFGVDLFFVISGFIMATIAGNASWQKFLLDRARRIFPPYWFYTTLALIASFYVPTHLNSAFEHLWRSYLLIPDSGVPLLAVGWTLIHEMYFYYCFAFIIFFAGSGRFTTAFWLMIWTAAVIFLDTVARLYDISDPVVALIAHPLTLEFIFGAAIGILIRRNGAAFATAALVAGTITLMIVLSFSSLALDLIDHRGWSRIILVAVPCSLIVYGAVGIEMKGATAPHWLVALGNASYSTYLSHVLVLSAIGHLFAVLPSHNLYLETAFVIVCIVAANVAGLVSCRVIERRSGKGWGYAKIGGRLIVSRAKSSPPH